MQDAYRVAWRDYSKRRLRAAVAFISWPILVGTIWIGFVTRLPDTRLLPLFVALAVAAFIPVVVLRLRLMAFKCPRCHAPFFWRGLYGNSFARRCVRCKLPKWGTGQ